MSRSNAIDGHILSIIQSHEIHEQIDLQNMLKERGHDIPQATLSRRLKKLKIAKVSGVYKAIDLNMPTLPIVLNIQISEFGLIILHTHPGNASSLAYFIDQKYVNYRNSDSGILGTIAGDDTILLIIKSKNDLNKVLKLLQAEFPYLRIT
ncbi:ArgR family transcriptional regulator [Candidatus Trichorickettsia mobilis]|uniref:Arginine repressor n=1 Tax=Candidatus Trichorickettsia mobilis TaxID=1346319 RepID=A0ABZ0UQ04_9RICK|nr:ArgR family transcriptional regulator [Candidatus Trichorickettsia mobilis]WPY00140.1 ArgR family transcriptional regulator [Candidatus Trichorickettsia mobilis]